MVPGGLESAGCAGGADCAAIFGASGLLANPEEGGGVVLVGAVGGAGAAPPGLSGIPVAPNDLPDTIPDCIIPFLAAFVPPAIILSVNVGVAAGFLPADLANAAVFTLPVASLNWSATGEDVAGAAFIEPFVLSNSCPTLLVRGLIDITFAAALPAKPPRLSKKDGLVVVVAVVVAGTAGDLDAAICDCAEALAFLYEGVAVVVPGVIAPCAAAMFITSSFLLLINLC